MTLRVGIIVAQSKPEALDLAQEIVPWLAEQGCTVIDEEGLYQKEPADYLITLGGDGLIMRIAHRLPDIPILGINVGRVGFLARTERGDWHRALSRLISGDCTIQEGPTLIACVQRGDATITEAWAINDVVVRSGMHLIDVELYLDGQFVNTYPGDGMIVATPQGSTAYCMAAGGPVLAAGVRGFSVTPICAHSPIRTTLVSPEESLIELVIGTEHEANLILDGIPILDLARGDLVQVRRGEHTFKLAVVEGMNFYQAFRSKFNFMIRPDAVPTRASTPTNTR